MVTCPSRTSSFNVPSSSEASGTPSERQPSVTAPAAWRAIEFISDLHLMAAMPRTAAAFTRYLDRCDADALFLLGDVFEVWVGDDIQGNTIDGDVFARSMMAALADAAKRRFVGVMMGNRDFLLGAQGLSTHGLVPLADPCLLTAFGERVVLTHGDALCLDDTEYQRFRAQVRQPQWQREFLAQDRSLRVQAARRMRDASEARRATGEPMSMTDVDPSALNALLIEHDSVTVIHGHTHRPATHRPAASGLSPGTTRYVLSDWDLDGHPPRAEAFRWTAEGMTRRPLPAD